jgi:hypothetical protein
MAKRSKKAEKAVEAETGTETVLAVKGFDANFQCRGFQFEVGKTYKHDGPVVVCQTGFHAIEGYPLEVFGYYPPGGSRYADVAISGSLTRHDDDSKIAGAEIAIKTELHLPEIVDRSVKWILDRITDTKVEANTGDRSAATNTGYQSAATNTGYQSAASVDGKNSAALASGYGGRVKGAMGCALFLVERDGRGNIIGAWSGIVGRDGVKPDVWYSLRDGKPEEVAS